MLRTLSYVSLPLSLFFERALSPCSQPSPLRSHEPVRGIAAQGGPDPCLGSNDGFEGVLTRPGADGELFAFYLSV